MYKYLLSAIMPVYNSALYLKEALDSIVNQTIGIENIQLIIVNDGSSDDSAKIISQYCEKYPSIVYIEKENGGVSSARNEGLLYVDGKYTTFPDPDDIIDLNAYKDAVDFLEENYEKTDVVSFPIRLFGSVEKEHSLNDKFKNGNRIIDLEKESSFQLHITASVIKSDVARKIKFKSSLVTSEDAEALLRILIDTPSLGVINTAYYNYRKHDVSLINTAPQKVEWYSEHIKEYFNSILDYALEKRGKVPKFVQSAMMYDLSWKLSQRRAPLCLTHEQINEFKEHFYSCISRLDDDVILISEELSDATKHHLLLAKHGAKLQKLDDDMLLGGTIKLSEFPYILEFVDTSEDKVKISCRAITSVLTPKITRGAVYLNGRAIYSSKPEYESRVTFLGEEIISNIMLDFEFPRDELSSKSAIYFALELDGLAVVSSNIKFGKFFPLTDKYESSFALVDDLILTHDENMLLIEKSTKKNIKKYRHVFEKELWKSNGFAERKAVIARKLARLYKWLHKKPLWIISDRLSQASDNGETLFRYLCESKPKNIRYLYAIRRGEDFSRLKKQGRVVDRASLRYKVLHLCADVIISSQAEDFVLDPFDYYGQPYKDILTQQSFVFLQHGVIKDDLSAWLNKYNKNIKGFVTSANAESQSILENSRYHYTENEVWQTGLARFDNLESKPERIITIAPTWRRYLAGSIDISSGKWSGSERTNKSAYVEFWSSLLKDKRLLETLKHYDYKIVFAPHPNMGQICDFIDTSSNIIVDKEPNYKEIYKSSSLMITDYSSAVFDFAYLDKPIIYAQFDKDEFFSGIHSYEKGYFDYELDGFGKVTYTLDETVDAVIQCIENGCKNEQLYLDRINSFYAYRDRQCCERIIQKIMNLGDKNDKRK